MAAEHVVGVIAEHLFNEALSLAAEEFSLVFHFKHDLESLAGELETIQALIADADSKDIDQSSTIQLWLKRLKAVASDAEDVLEEYKYELLQQKAPQKKWLKVCNFYSPIRKLAYRVKMAHKIKDISLRLKNVNEEGKKYGLNPFEFLNTSSEVKMDRLTSPSVQEAEIVGRDGDVSKVVDMLINENDKGNFEVIGIVGMAGQGKTTLAQLVYKKNEVVKHFEHRIWVCVSEDFKVERLLNEMVQSITQENSNLTNRQALIEKLQKSLKGRRYLFVLDDVWNENQEKWDRMEKDLREIGGSRGTKIMVTTRSDKVVSTMLVSQIHRLGQLSDDDSLSLFKQRAFAQGGVVETPQFVDIGRRIVKRCGGVPLAIKALGGLLYSKKDMGEWLSIENNDIWSLTNSEEGVLSSIKLSYNHLPSISLKQCFAYCSIYPKNTKMERKNLIRLWMAQGFLNPPKGSPLQMEDLGNDYFDILLWNSLLQEPVYDEFEKILYCKMHDVVHDFASLISKDYCITMKVGQDDKNIEVVHLSLVSTEKKMVDMSQGISPKLRTLYLPSGVIGNELIKFRHLRTLILSDYKIEQLPKSIGRLKQLRYIDIRKTWVRALPASYVKLYNLQTLRANLEEDSMIFLGSLINLRHIDLYHEGCMLVGISQLAHLQTLSYFTVSDKRGCKIEELGPQGNLRGGLTIYGLDKVKNGEEAQKANLSEKLKVVHLELCWTEDRKASNLNDEDVIESLKPHPYLKSLAIYNYRGSRFPSWMKNGQLQNLVKLELDNCDLCEQFPPLGHLPSLLSLRIEDCEKLAVLPSLQGFPSLDSLEIKNVGIVSLPDMPCGLLSLLNLTIGDCEELVALPRWLELCTSLATLEITSCPALQRIDGCGLERLPNLEIMEIGPLAEELDYFPWPATNAKNGDFASLEVLTLCGWSQLTSLPVQLQYLPSLRSLSIVDFEELEALPEWLGNIKSLRYLELFNCENLEYMPSAEAIRRLTNLEKLDVFDCPCFTEMCTRQSGPEWQMLAHIPYILVDGEYIQSQN